MRATPKVFERPVAEDSGIPKFAMQHYTVAEIASLWNLSENTVRRLFEKEPDVLTFGNQNRASVDDGI